MSAKKFVLPAVGAVLVAGGAAGYWYFNKLTMKDGATPIEIAKVVPQTAYMTTFVTSDLQAWSKLQQFGTPEAQQALDKGLKSVQQELMSKNNIDFEKDLKPWVGNAMVAMLPSEAGSNQPNPLLVVSVRDKVSALSFAAKLASQGSGKGKEGDYKGSKTFTSEDGSIHVAMVGDYLAIAPDQKTLEQAIDTTQGQPSLASKPDAESVLSKPVDVENKVAQVYLLDYASAVQQLSKTSSKATPIPAKTLEQLKKVKSLVAGIGINDAGIRVKAIADLDPQVSKVDYKPAAGTVVAQFPADTLALVSGANLSYYWSQAVEQAKQNPDSQKAIDQMRQSVKSANFDLDKDIFSWMNGEFGVGLIPSDRGILAQVGFGGVLVFDTSDRKTAEATLSKLDTMAKSNAVQVQERDVQGKKVTEWNTPYGSLLGHGWLDDNSMFVALGGPMVDVAAAKPAQALDASDTFKTVTSTLPKQNLGYFYLDMDKTMAIVNRFSAMSNSPIPPEPAALLASIKGIGVTSAKIDSGSGQMDMLLALKKAAAK